MKPLRSLIVLFLAVLSLAACGDVREDLGLGRSSPDEFAVVDRAPLSMPPDFALRPPKPGEPRPQEVDMQQRASTTLFGSNINPAQAPQGADNESSAEKEVLASTGADKASPDIRMTVDREEAEKVVGNDHLVNDILLWRKAEKPAATVDAAAETARIKNAQSKNQPLNQGATPVIERDKSGWLGL